MPSSGFIVSDVFQRNYAETGASLKSGLPLGERRPTRESGVRSQESGDRRQEAGDRRQESIFLLLKYFSSRAGFFDAQPRVSAWQAASFDTGVRFLSLARFEDSA